MDEERRLLCPENQGLANYVLQKKREHSDKPKGLSENLERTFLKAYRNVCDSKEPINTLKDLSQIKGFGKWMLKLMKGYFDNGATNSEQEDLLENCDGNGKNAKGRKRYIPQRNYVAYELLITLHRGTRNEKEFMRKQELMDAADASGISHAPVAPEKGKGKVGLGNSKRKWYSGWNCMTTLIQKGLVVKSSNPAKYMLTSEGREVANECITRSGLPTVDILSDDEMDPAQQTKKTPNQNSTSSCTMREEQPFADQRSRAQSAIPSNILEKFTPFGYFTEQVAAAFREVSNGSEDRDPSTLWLSVMCHLRTEVYNPCLDSQNRRKDSAGPSRAQTYFIVERKKVDDLRSSIRDNRYRDQKLRLQRSGFKKLMYVIEGDPNHSDAVENIKMACFTTEILEGFDVLRTNGLGDTLRKYGYLTKAIYQYYKSQLNDDESKVTASYPSSDSFVKRCQDLDKMTISDVFAIQLMQVLLVTEEIAIAVLDMYPTLLSLASAYSHLEGNVSTQEEMLKNRSNNVICATASKNIFKLVGVNDFYSCIVCPFDILKKISL